MITKLRNKIIIINVALMGLILLTALITVFTIGFTRLKKDSDTRLSTALQYDLNDGHYTDNPLFKDITLIVYDSENRTLTEFYNNASIDIPEDQIFNHLRNIVHQNESGFYMPLQCYYKYTYEGDIFKLALLNVQQNSMGTFSFFSVLTCVISLLCYFVVSYILANIALKPVEENWKQQKQFIADASHELKTPLSVIMANTEIIASHPDSTVESQMKWIENTRSESKRMAELVSNLLFIAKSDDGFRVQMSNTNLSDCIDSMVLNFESKFYENHKNFQYDIKPDLFINGNDSQIKQLVSILLDNANKYSSGDGNIELMLDSTPKTAILTVSNDSQPLTDLQLHHLFDRFYTIDQSRNKGNAGNGLGLSIAKVICENHNGRINAEYSENRLTFTAVFPLNKKSSKNKNN